MKKIIALVLALCCLMGMLPLAEAATAKTMTVSFSAETYQNRARTALKQINSFRRSEGLKPLTMTADLEKVALQRAAEIFVLFDDESRPDMTGYETACADYASLQGVVVGEIIGAGCSKADDMIAVWETDNADLILDSDFTHAGLACVYVKGSNNEYYWVLYLAGLPEGTKAREADSDVKAGAEKNFKVEVSSGMFAKADNSHKRFELRPSNVNMGSRSTATPTVYLYDRYDVKIGKIDNEDLSYKSSNTSVFTVSSDGTLTKKKAGTGTLTVKFTNLEDAQCTVTVGSGSSSSSSSSSSSGVTAATIKDAKPSFSVSENSKTVTFNSNLKGSSGYVLYRSTTKTGTYSKWKEEATTSKWTLKVDREDLTRSYWFKVRAYKNSNGKRVYSEYSDPVQVK